MKSLYWPNHSIVWPEKWWHLIENEKLRKDIQKELHKEISSKHPLWNLNPVVFAKCNANDDILVHLNDNRFAIVHLIWNSKVDQLPESFPYTTFFQDETKLQQYLTDDI